MSKDKKPKTKVEPSTDKQPKVASVPTSFHRMKPSWRISIIEMKGPYGWNVLDAEMVLYVQTKLSDFEKMTWAEIFTNAKKSNHSVSVIDLCSEAQSRLGEIKQDDIDQLFCLRLSGKERVWGKLDEGVFTLLWWDPDHQVCPSNKKHT